MSRGIRNLFACLAVASGAVPVHQDIEGQDSHRSVVGANGHTLVVIQGGEFTMGSPHGERGRSARLTSLDQLRRRRQRCTRISKGL